MQAKEITSSAGKHTLLICSTFSTGAFKCVRCPKTSYSDVTGSSACTLCPDNHEVPFFGGTSRLDCTCKPGLLCGKAPFFFLFLHFTRILSFGNFICVFTSLFAGYYRDPEQHDNNTVAACFECPQGGDCAGVDALPTVKVLKLTSHSPSFFSAMCVAVPLITSFFFLLSSRLTTAWILGLF